ncbi:proton extrusion protein PcxA [Nostoc sp. CENA67]|uniref:Proton extrusion protein PxcA n=1 Tax=Amazonocrinis nigriterrae CENA67 TaxID=2794033 RepID=A0A8J7I245_9NOST|nr:proton extrusion protein PcxA [Amazonocrinis nigriterrae]MBH8566909.1 proton extrusion protein PcxA [Amazonocrinis nigriterrae CENA67]
MNQWFLDTPERALLEAYKAAQTIKNIEAEYFGHQKISAESVNYTENVMSYWQGCLNQNLTIIKVRLAEFQLSRSLLNISNSALLEKLKFIDEVVDKYTFRYEPGNYSNSAIISENQKNNNGNNQRPDSLNLVKVQPISQKTGVLPRSIGRTINKIKSDFTPQAEEEFVRNFQISRRRTVTTIKFFLTIIIVPLLTQQLSKQLLINPIVKNIQGENGTQVFLNSQMQEEALSELNLFQKRLKFQNLIHQHPPLSLEAVEESTKEKAIEIAEESRHKSSDAISNIFADLISLFAFAIIIVNSKKEILVVKAFIDELVYGISDSAKAFLIILFTDIFVGFHSPHGWEVLLEGFSEHFGLAANRSVIFMFIATFPVILDTIFKYWIFRYLSRLSPSALATLKEMNE